MKSEKEKSRRITSASEGTCFEDATELGRKTSFGDAMGSGSSENFIHNMPKRILEVKR